MLKHTSRYRIKYADTDMMGYLYYGQYASLYEMGRVEALRSIGISYKDMEKIHKIMMPVVHVEARYLLPLVYDEIITIDTYLNSMPSKLIEFKSIIFNELGAKAHEASVKLFFVDMVSNKRISCPNYIRDILESYFL